MTNRSKIWLASLGLTATILPVAMLAAPQKDYTFSNGQVVDAGQLNRNFDELYRLLNGTDSGDINLNGYITATSMIDRNNTSYVSNPTSTSKVNNIKVLDDSSLRTVMTLNDGYGDSAYLAFYNQITGDPILQLTTATSDAAYVSINNRDGRDLVHMTSSTEGAGWLGVYGTDGLKKVAASTVAGSGGTRGAISVYGADGNQAWIATGRQGAMRVTPHPTNAKEELLLAPVSAPEASTVVRGRGLLKAGRARVDLPTHFTARVDADSITVTLTPRSAQSRGLAIASQDARGLTVVELMQGEGSYAFDYTVTGTVSAETFPATVRRGEGMRIAGIDESSGHYGDVEEAEAAEDDSLISEP